MAYKHDYDKALTRLRIILQRLNDGESLSVKELAEDFNVSTRTIQRDFNEKLVGLYPIYQENRKWKMEEGFKIEKIREVEDQIVLDILEKMTDGIGGKFASRAQKLLSKIKNNDINPIYTKLDLEDISDNLKEIELLEKAIKQQNKIEYNYTLDNGYVVQKLVEPLKIVNYQGFWYLLAQDNQEKTIKKYYLKMISNVKLQQEKFSTTKEIDTLLNDSISIWFNQDVEPFNVKLFAHKWAAKYFKRKPLPTQKTLVENEDGSMEFSIMITDEMEILPIIKYWIPYLHIIEPISIKEVVKQDIEKYLQYS